MKCDKEEYNLFEDIKITVKLDNIKKIDEYGVGVIISNSKGEKVSVINSIRVDKVFNKDVKEVNLIIRKNCFVEDKYYITVSICDEKIMFSYDKAEYATSFRVKVPKNNFGVVYADGSYACEYDIIEN